MLRLSPTERIICWRLQEGREVAYEELIHALYGNRIDGGADDPFNVIRKTISDLRRRFDLLGVAIQTRMQFGYAVPLSQINRFRDLLSEEIRRNTPDSIRPQRCRLPRPAYLEGVAL